MIEREEILDWCDREGPGGAAATTGGVGQLEEENAWVSAGRCDSNPPFSAPRQLPDVVVRKATSPPSRVKRYLEVLEEEHGRPKQSVRPKPPRSRDRVA